MPVRRSSVTGMPKPTLTTSSSIAARASSTASTIVAMRDAWSSPNARRRTRWRTARSGPTTPARSLVPPRSTPMTQPVCVLAADMGAATIPTADGGRETRVQGLPQPPRLLPKRDGDDAMAELRAPAKEDNGAAPPAPPRERPATLPGPPPQRKPKRPRKRISPWRILRWVLAALVVWVVLSGVLFMVSAQIQRGDLKDEVGPQLERRPLSADRREHDPRARLRRPLRRPRRTRLRRPEPLGLDHAPADRRRRQRVALDPARHGRRHPRPRHEQDQRRLRARRPRARDPDRQGVPRGRDQPRRRGQLRELPRS